MGRWVDDANDDRFDGSGNRYGRAVPEYQAPQLDAFVVEGVDWNTVLAATTENATQLHHLLVPEIQLTHGSGRS